MQKIWYGKTTNQIFKVYTILANISSVNKTLISLQEFQMKNKKVFLCHLENNQMP